MTRDIDERRRAEDLVPAKISYVFTVVKDPL